MWISGGQPVTIRFLEVFLRAPPFSLAYGPTEVTFEPGLVSQISQGVSEDIVLAFPAFCAISLDATWRSRVLGAWCGPGQLR